MERSGHARWKGECIIDRIRVHWGRRSPARFKADLGVEHEMDDAVGVGEVDLASLAAKPNEHSFGGLHPVGFYKLALLPGSECSEDLLVFKETDFGVDGRTDLEAEHDCVVHFKLNAEARPRAFLQGILLLH